MGKKRRLLTIILLSLIIVSLVAGLQNAEIVKANSKTIIVPTDYLSIQDAINNAVEGDTIFVKKGVYVENPVVNKSVSLVGEDMDATVIDVTAGLKVESNDVTITGFTIYDGWAGIILSANFCNIEGNKITDATNGIRVNGENNYINGNIFQSIGLSSAIQLSYSDNNFVNNNYIDSCTEGIQLREGSSSNTVKGNTITNCKDVAIRMLGSGLGKTWYGPNNNTVMQNIISNSGCGTSIYGANGNIISNNNYLNNTIQFSANEDYYLSLGGSRSVNFINQNYWSDYSGTDANRDGIGGIGDTPYVIDAYNQDNSPILLPISLATPTATTTPSPPNSGPTSSPTPSPSIPEFQQWTTLFLFGIIVVTAGLSIYFKKYKR